MKKGKAVNNTVACGDGKSDNALRIRKIMFPDELSNFKEIIYKNIRYLNLSHL